jgi:hypothetical protein
MKYWYDPKFMKSRAMFELLSVPAPNGRLSQDNQYNLLWEDKLREVLLRQRDQWGAPKLLEALEELQLDEDIDLVNLEEDVGLDVVAKVVQAHLRRKVDKLVGWVQDYLQGKEESEKKLVELDQAFLAESDALDQPNDDQKEFLQEQLRLWDLDTYLRQVAAL